MKTNSLLALVHMFDLLNDLIFKNHKFLLRHFSPCQMSPPWGLPV